MKTKDNILTSRAVELYGRSEYEIAVSDFFSPGERREVYKELIAQVGSGVSGCFFWGGCRSAERCTAVFLPDWYIPDGAPTHKMPMDTARVDFFAEYLREHPEVAEEIPITALKIVGSGFKNLTHRDFLGSILALGVDRAVIGDIAVLSESEAIVFCAKRIAPYLLSELHKVGRDGVKITEIQTDPAFEVPRKFEKMTLVLSSLRLDGAVKAITHKSREEAARMVESGLVDLSYETKTEPAAPVHEEDTISIRGFGKYIIGPIEGETKSGRLKIECKKYI